MPTTRGTSADNSPTTQNSRTTCRQLGVQVGYKCRQLGVQVPTTRRQLTLLRRTISRQLGVQMGYKCRQLLKDKNNLPTTRGTNGVQVPTRQKNKVPTKRGPRVHHNSGSKCRQLFFCSVSLFLVSPKQMLVRVGLTINARDIAPSTTT